MNVQGTIYIRVHGDTLDSVWNFLDSLEELATNDEGPDDNISLYEVHKVVNE